MEYDLLVIEPDDNETGVVFKIYDVNCIYKLGLGSIYEHMLKTETKTQTIGDTTFVILKVD